MQDQIAATEARGSGFRDLVWVVALAQGEIPPSYKAKTALDNDTYYTGEHVFKALE